MPFVYLAGPVGPNQDSTFNLAIQHGVIAKSFFRDKTKSPQADNNLRLLKENATLYLAYRNENGGIAAVRTFILQNAEQNSSVTPLAANEVVQDQYNGNVPNVVGTVNEGTDLQRVILEMGYLTDPKVNVLTVICVAGVEAKQANDAPLDAINAWYAGLTYKKTTVHEIPLEAVSKPSS